jgi:hypothetical protein
VDIELVADIMSEPFDWKKAIDLTLPALFKSTSVWLKGGAVLFIIGIVGWSLWTTFNPKPRETTQQTAHEICNNYNTPKATFGCTAVRIFMRGNTTKD